MTDKKPKIEVLKPPASLNDVYDEGKRHSKYSYIYKPTS